MEGMVVEVAARLVASERLRARRFEVIPVAGRFGPTTLVQGRGPGDSTTPSELAELISSIATVGLLLPLLLEEAPDGDLLVVAGHRRLAALRWGHTHLVDHPGYANFESAPAVICPGPLREEERRTWQLVENLARTDLQPGELAAALLFERSAVLAAKLDGAGHPVPESVWSIEDPVRRWVALDRVRRDVGMHHDGAPWSEVIHRLGLQLTADKARMLVRAFSVLPAELSSEMDAQQVALASRLEFVKLDRGRRDAAAAIWAAIRDRAQPRLLTGAVRAALQDPSLSADDAVAAALDTHDHTTVPTGSDVDVDVDDADDAPTLEVPSVGAVCTVLDELLAVLDAGGRLDRYAAGDLRLRMMRLAEHLDCCVGEVR